MRERLRLTAFALCQRCKHDQNWSLSRVDRWTVTIRCVLAIWMNREKHDHMDYDFIGSAVAVAFHDWKKQRYSEYAGADGYVTYGARHGFWFADFMDGWP